MQHMCRRSECGHARKKYQVQNNEEEVHIDMQRLIRLSGFCRVANKDQGQNRRPMPGGKGFNGKDVVTHIEDGYQESYQESCKGRCATPSITLVLQLADEYCNHSPTTNCGSSGGAHVRPRASWTSKSLYRSLFAVGSLHAV